MKHATITIPEGLSKELEHYLGRQDSPLELSAVVETAIRELLEQQDRPCNPEYRPFRITPVEEKYGSSERDLSINHDKYLADDAYDDAFSRLREQL